MIRGIVLWLLDWLRESLDPELKQRLDEYKAERQRLQDEISAEQAGLKADAETLAQLRAQRDAIKTQTVEVETEIGSLKQEVKKIDDEKSTVANRTDHDVLRGRL